MTRTKSLIALWCVALAALLMWNLPAAYAAEGADNVSAQEEQTQMQRFSQRFALIEATHKRNNDTWVELNRQYGELRGHVTAEDYLAAVIRLTQRLGEFCDSVEAAGMEQMDFKNRLERYSEGNMLLQQELTLVARYSSQLQVFGKAQGEQLVIADRTLKQLQKAAASLPPPEEFELEGGMRFKLIVPPRKGGKRVKPFYAMVTPVTWAQWRRFGGATLAGAEEADEDAAAGGMTVWQASEFIAAVSRTVGGRFYLPSAEQVRLMLKDGQWRALGSAVWLGGVWNEEHDAGAAAERFQVSWAGIWDPADVLGGTVKLSGDNPGICPEVPQASYRQLGCLLIAEVEVGQAVRAARVRELVGKLPAAAEEVQK